jgi:hypothetical protein
MPDADVIKRRTHLTTFRFSESLAHSLQKEAADEGTTVNALANSIISDHFDWHKKAQYFGFSTVPRALLKKVLEGLDDETVARIGREIIPGLWKEMAEFWSQDSSPEGILNFQLIRSKFNPNNQTRVAQEGDTITVVLRHDFGPKWSLMAKSGLEEFVKQSFHVKPRISAGDSVITARFKVNQHKWSS